MRRIVKTRLVIVAVGVLVGMGVIVTVFMPTVRKAVFVLAVVTVLVIVFVTMIARVRVLVLMPVRMIMLVAVAVIVFVRLSRSVFVRMIVLAVLRVPVVMLRGRVIVAVSVFRFVSVFMFFAHRDLLGVLDLRFNPRLR